MSLFDLLSGGESKAMTARQLSTAVGAKPEQVERLTELSLPTLLAALKRNSSSQEGAEALARALDQHKDDRVDNVPAYLGKADTNDGSKILQHIFGNDNQRVQTTLAKETGMDLDQVSGVLTRMAPMLLGMLGQQKAQQNLAPSGISGLLSSLLGGATQSQQPQPSGLGGLLSGLLGGAASQPQQPQQSGIGDLLSSLLGGAAQPQQPQPQPSGLGGLLTGLLGASTPVQQPQPSGLGGLLSLLLGGGAQAQQPSGFGSLLSGLIGAKPAQTQQATQLGLPVLIEALRRNTSTQAGRNALARALEQHEDDPVDDLAGFMSRADRQDGDRIVQHIFGSDRTRVQADLATETGLETQQVSELLARLAPLVLGSLGQVKKQSNLGPDDIAGLLGKLSGGIQSSQAGTSDAMTRLLNAELRRR